MLPADRIQIQQVVTNLILNSTEVMESVEPEMRKLIIELSTAPSTHFGGAQNAPVASNGAKRGGKPLNNPRL